MNPTSYDREAHDVMTALAMAERAVTDGASPGAVRVLARALLRMRDLMTSLHRTHLGPGARLRMSVKLMTDLYELPDHESVTVRVVRVEYGGDGVAVLVLQRDEVVS